MQVALQIHFNVELLNHTHGSVGHQLVQYFVPDYIISTTIG